MIQVNGDKVGRCFNTERFAAPAWTLAYQRYRQAGRGTLGIKAQACSKNNPAQAASVAGAVSPNGFARRGCAAAPGRVKCEVRDQANGITFQHHFESGRHNAATRGASAAVLAAREVFRRAELSGI